MLYNKNNREHFFWIVIAIKCGCKTFIVVVIIVPHWMQTSENLQLKTNNDPQILKIYCVLTSALCAIEHIDETVNRPGNKKAL